MTAPRADDASAVWARRLLIAYVISIVATYTVIDFRMPWWLLVVPDLLVCAATIGLATAMRPTFRQALGPAAGVPLMAALVGGGLALVGGAALVVDPVSAVLAAVTGAEQMAFGLWVATAGLAWILVENRFRWRAGLASFGGVVRVTLGLGLIAGWALDQALVFVLGAGALLAIPFFIALTRRADPPMPVPA